jgi:acetyl esterase/lipase
VDQAPPYLQPFLIQVDPADRERAGSLDIYRPAGGQQRSAILFVHGGPAPPGPTPRDWPVYVGYSAAAVERDVVAAVVDHRLAGGTGLIEEAAADVQAAAEQLRSAAGVDPDRIALWFFSGAGLLAARWLEQAPPWLRCLAATYPFFCRPAELPHLRTAADAIACAPDLPVVLTRVGLERPELAEAVEEFVAAAGKAHANLEIIDVPNGHHGFDIIDRTDESRAAVRGALDRVVGHLAP